MKWDSPGSSTKRFSYALRLRGIRFAWKINVALTDIDRLKIIFNMHAFYSLGS